jgi:thymidylate synthase (FAD)
MGSESKMNVKIISATAGVVDGTVLGPEDLIAYTARVSNPANQMNLETAPKLLGYLIKNKHWSPFEMASMTVEIKTSRAIAQQILRHRSFSFQEFSQRYAKATEFVTYSARRQDDKNRQNSIDDLPDQIKADFLSMQKDLQEECQEYYERALRMGIAKEQARFLLPLSTQTTLYMCGTVRSWIHYLELRCANGTQKEHKDIADGVKAIFVLQFPNVAKALDWQS